MNTDDSIDYVYDIVKHSCSTLMQLGGSDIKNKLSKSVLISLIILFYD